MQFSRLPAPVAIRTIDMFRYKSVISILYLLLVTAAIEVNGMEEMVVGKVCAMPFTHQPYFESCSMCVPRLRDGEAVTGKRASRLSYRSRRWMITWRDIRGVN